MDKNTRYARVRETGEMKKLTSVGNGIWLDENAKEVYNSDELEFLPEGANVVEMSPDEFLRKMRRLADDAKRNFDEAKDLELEKMVLSFRMSLAIEIIKKRPYIGIEALRKRIDEITDKVVFEDE